MTTYQEVNASGEKIAKLENQINEEIFGNIGLN